MNHQDWNTVVLSKKKKPSANISNKPKEKKDENDDIIIKNKKVDTNFKNFVINARKKLNITQAKFATALNLKSITIQEIENGKWTHHGPTVDKIKKYVERELKKIDNKN